jgi:nicotinate phosphoribosyltransferase
MVKIVSPRSCIEFGTRRAQGPDGALSAAQYAYIGGFSSTSNVLCAQKFGMPCVGTMSHAYVTSFTSLNDIHPDFDYGKILKKKVI